MPASRHGMVTTKVTKRTKATLVALPTIMPSMTISAVFLPFDCHYPFQKNHSNWTLSRQLSYGFFTLHGLSNLCMSLLVILSPSLKVISSVLSRLISALSWSLMATFVDNKYNLWRGHAVSHKAPQDIFRGSLAFGGIVSSYFSGALMATYRVGFLAPAIVVLVKEQPRFSTTRKKISLLLAPIVGVAPRRTRRDIPNAVLQRFLIFCLLSLRYSL
ncbi:hypothetical protein CR513_09497, partial [Mucuna pruriens]